VASWWADTGIGARVMDELDDPAKKPATTTAI
jgi:hypothetical protein